MNIIKSFLRTRPLSPSFKFFVTLLIYYYDVGLEVFGFAHSCRLCYVMLCKFVSITAVTSE